MATNSTESRFFPTRHNYLILSPRTFLLTFCINYDRMCVL